MTYFDDLLETQNQPDVEYIPLVEETDDAIEPTLISPLNLYHFLTGLFLNIVTPGVNSLNTWIWGVCVLNFENITVPYLVSLTSVINSAFCSQIKLSGRTVVTKQGSPTPMVYKTSTLTWWL